MNFNENENNSNSLKSYSELEFSQNMSATQTEFKKYFNFFEFAPIALWIEDFSKVKKYIDKIAAENNTNTKSYILQNAAIIPELASMVKIKEANEAAVKLYKAKSKKDLLNNLDKCFTEDSNKGFGNMVADLLVGKTETEVETFNYNFNGERIDILIKFKVASGCENTLENVIVSVEDITERKKAKLALIDSQNRYIEAQSIARIGSWSFDYKTNELHWSDEVYNLLAIKKEENRLSLNFYLSFVHEEDRDEVGDFSIATLLKSPVKLIKYRIVTANNEIKYIQEKRTVTIEKGRITRIVGIGQDIT